jgi:hypothetical protein
VNKLLELAGKPYKKTYNVQFIKGKEVSGTQRGGACAITSIVPFFQTFQL